MWPADRLRPGCSAPSIVPFFVASSKSQSVMVSPLSATLILRPTAVTSWLFHSPTGFRNSRFAGAMP